MEAVRQDRDRAGRSSPSTILTRATATVEDENAIEDAYDRVVSSLVAPRHSRREDGAQNTCAVGMGHQRSCTRPMMYFFGTKPQWRLSELLFRWSPITK